LKGAQNQKQEGLNICIDMIHQAREIEGVQGVHIMAYRQEQHVAEIVERSGALEGRTPWHPGLYETSESTTFQTMTEEAFV
jgi:methylenetetrahydrofolate reductase (NADPH)